MVRPSASNVSGSETICAYGSSLVILTSPDVGPDGTTGSKSRLTSAWEPDWITKGGLGVSDIPGEGACIPKTVSGCVPVFRILKTVVSVSPTVVPSIELTAAAEAETPTQEHVASPAEDATRSPAQETIAALDQWLDAIHVARAQRRA